MIDNILVSQQQEALNGYDFPCTKEIFNTVIEQKRKQEQLNDV